MEACIPKLRKFFSIRGYRLPPPPLQRLGFDEKSHLHQNLKLQNRPLSSYRLNSPSLNTGAALRVHGVGVVSTMLLNKHIQFTTPDLPWQNSFVAFLRRLGRCELGKPASVAARLTRIWFECNSCLVVSLWTCLFTLVIRWHKVVIFQFIMDSGGRARNRNAHRTRYT